MSYGVADISSQMFKYISASSQVKPRTVLHKQLYSSCVCVWHTADRASCVGAPWSGPCFPCHCLQLCLPMPSYVCCRGKSHCRAADLAQVLTIWANWTENSSLTLSLILAVFGSSNASTALALFHSVHFPSKICGLVRPWHSPWHYCVVFWGVHIRFLMLLHQPDHKRDFNRSLSCTFSRWWT